MRAALRASAATDDQAPEGSALMIGRHGPNLKQGPFDRRGDGHGVSAPAGRGRPVRRLSSVILHPSGYEPMLATAERQRVGDAWAYDAKLDGWRAVVHVARSGVAVCSRPGRDITATLPSLQALVGLVPVGTVLDGELVAGSGGASTFYRLTTLMATRPERRAAEVSFVASDVLALDGRRTTARPYRERRRLLEDLAFAGPAWCTSRCWTEVRLDDLLTACEALDVEGVVAKRLDSPYRPGQRSRDWVKLKTPGWRIEHGPYRHEHDRGARSGGGAAGCVA